MELERDLAVRIGVATGTVVVGDIVGEGASQEAAITGGTPNLAARLQEIAEPDSVVIAETTHALTGGIFELDDLGSRDLKGFVEPVRSWSVTGIRRTESRFDATRAERLTELIGRDEEMEILLRRWQRTKAGEGQIVLISGEPGIGKSRLVRELQDRIAGEPYYRLRNQCSPYHTNSALYPVIDQLERAARIETDDSADTKLDKLEALLSMSGQSVEHAVPLVGSLLSLSVGDRYPELNFSPQRRKEMTLQSLVDQVSGLAEREPVLFVFEDAHWIDPTTMELLELIIERAPDIAVLMLITYRPEFEAPWIGRSRITPMILSRLERSDCARMVERVWSVEGIPEDIRDRIANQTDGVPLFIEELTRSVLDSVVGSPDQTAAFNVPTTIQDSLEARLDHLGAAKEVAQIGAVIGRTFDFDLLMRVVPLEDEALRTNLNQLAGSGLVIARGNPPDATYTFKHALIQDTAYGSLLRDRRAELHGSIGAVLEREFPDTMETAPEILAHHFTEARIPEAGAKYWLRAGESAFRRSAMLEGSAHLEAGLGVADTLPPGQGRDELLVRLHLARASALRQSRGPMNLDVTKSYSKAYELSQGLEDSQLRFSASVSWLAANSAREESSNVLKHAQDLVSLAGSDSAQLGMAQMVLGEILLMQGRSEIAVPHLTQAAKLYDPSIHAITAIEYGRDFGVFSGSLHAIALAYLGYLDKALAVVRELVGQGEARQRSYFHLYALTFETFVLMLRRDTKDLIIAAENLIALAEQVGFLASVHSAQVQLIWAKSLINEYDNGAREVESVIKEMQTPLWLRPWYNAMLAKVYLREERYAEALNVVGETLTWSSECGIVHFDAGSLVIQGDACVGVELADRSKAESYYQKAIAVARSQSAKLIELRAATSLARLWHSLGKSTEARDLLAPVYGWFTEGFDTADLKEAKALLDELN